jgi:nucleoside-diphosphate-sugar epimerase
MLKILVTGGEGFIGSWIVEKLSQMGHRVTTLDSRETYDIIQRDDLDRLCNWRQRNWKKVTKISGNVIMPLDRVWLRKQDIVIHLASYPRAGIVNEYPEMGVENIVVGTTGLLQDCVEYGVKRFVYVSSSMIYGNFADGTNEKSITNPINIYGEAKLAGERLTQQFNRAVGLEYVIARPSGVYGAGDIPDRVLSKFFTAAEKNKDITVHDANNRVDFTYVEDTADGIIRCALEKKAANNIFNITAGSATSLGEAAKKIIQLTGSKSRIKDTGQHNLYPERGTLDISQARELLNYQPQYTFDQGIAKYYEWILKKNV